MPSTFTLLDTAWSNDKSAPVPKKCSLISEGYIPDYDSQIMWWGGLLTLIIVIMLVFLVQINTKLSRIYDHIYSLRLMHPSKI